MGNVFANLFKGLFGKKEMRILMVARRYPPDVRSGTETVFENLYAQARLHHEVRLVVGYKTSFAGFPPEAVAVDLPACAGKESVRDARRFSGLFAMPGGDPGRCAVLSAVREPRGRCQVAGAM